MMVENNYGVISASNICKQEWPNHYAKKLFQNCISESSPQQGIFIDCH